VITMALSSMLVPIASAMPEDPTQVDPSFTPHPSDPSDLVVRRVPTAEAVEAMPWDPADDYETKIGVPIYRPTSWSMHVSRAVRAHRRDEAVARWGLWVCGTIALVLALVPLVAR